MTSVLAEIGTNTILALLPAQERDLLLPALDTTHLPFGDILHEAGSSITHLHFPTGSAISLIAKDHEHTVDVTVIGKEGCSGSSVVQGSDQATSMALIQIGGTAVRLSTADFTQRQPQLPYLRSALARYNLLLMRQAVISVGCSQFHTPEQRLARWLMAHWHRTGIDTFPFGTDFLAAQAGLDSGQVAEVLARFKDEGCVISGHNMVKIMRRDALTAKACECFPLAKTATDEYVADLKKMATQS